MYIMKFMVWIINDIHVEFNDIHWVGCLNITRRMSAHNETSHTSARPHARTLPVNNNNIYNIYIHHSRYPRGHDSRYIFDRS